MQSRNPKTRAAFRCLLIVAIAILVIAAATQTPIVRLLLQQDADGGGNSFTNLNTLQATGSVYLGTVSGPITNQFGGAGGTGIQTNNGTGTNNIFTWTTGTAAKLDFDVATFGRRNTNYTPNGPAQTILGGADNWIGFTADGATIAGGRSNFISNASVNSSIGGGMNNQIGVLSGANTISGGEKNRIDQGAAYSAIAGGYSNVIELIGAQYSFIGGGSSNYINNPRSAAMGTRAAAVTSGTFVWSDDSSGVFASASNQTFIIRATGGVGIGTNNPKFMLHVRGPVDATAYTINGSPISGGAVTGLTNYPLYLRSTNIILGGHLNAISNAPSDNFAIILGGDDNFIGLATGVSVGGLQNAILDGANISSIVGGQANFIDTLAAASVIGGGYGNSISNAGEYDVIAGGNQNEIGLGAVYSVIPGGNQNYVGPSANYSFAAGDAAQALHNNTFVWSDGTVAPFASVNQRTFIINADNGVAIRTNDPAGNGLKVRGTIDATDGYLRDGQPVMNPGVYSYLRSTSPISTATNVEVTAYLLFETNNVIHWPIQSAFSIVFSNHTDTLSWSDDTAGRYEMRTLIVTAEGVTNIIQLDFRPRTNWIFQGQTTWFPPLNLAPDQTYTFTLRHIGGKTNVFISYETATNSLAPH